MRSTHVVKMSEAEFKVALVDGLEDELPGWAVDYASMFPNNITVVKLEDGGRELLMIWDSEDDL